MARHKQTRSQRQLDALPRDAKLGVESARALARDHGLLAVPEANRGRAVVAFYRPDGRPVGSYCLSGGVWSPAGRGWAGRRVVTLEQALTLATLDR